MKELMDRFRRLCGESHDISEHLGLLRGLACEPRVKVIVEIGFRTGVSATALASSGKQLFCYDLEACVQPVKKLRALAPKFHFHQGDSLKIEIPDCDLLHIDSLHTYKHLRAELTRHARYCRKWICLHDVATFGSRGKDGSRPGLAAAIRDFLETEGRDWRILLWLNNCNGMCVLQRASTLAMSWPTSTSQVATTNIESKQAGNE